MEHTTRAPELPDESGREDRLKLILLGVAVLLAVAYGVGLGFMESPLGTLFALLKTASSTRVGLALLAAVMVVGAASAVLFFLRRSPQSTQHEATEPADPLSGLATRSEFSERVSAELEHHFTQGRQLSVHLVDLDRFAALNALGEVYGDAVLRAVASKLSALAGGNERVGRTGDDEFGVIQPETGGARHAEIFAKRIQDSVREAISEAGYKGRLDASIGVAVAPEHGESAADLMRSAALALSVVKEAGGGAFRIYSRHLDLAAEGRQQLERAVADGVENGWFELHFQPQYDLAARRLVGFEALLRLDHPDLGMLMPNDYLRAACDCGAMPAIGEWVAREALTNAANWPRHLTLALNVCLEEMRGTDYAARLSEILESSGFDPGRLRLEIQECILASSSAEVADQLKSLAELGVVLVLDDFGVGNSNLQALARSGCRAVKIDRSFVKGIGKSGETTAVIRGLIGAAKGLGLQVSAEGIEQAEQAQMLLAQGCHLVQGYLFGRPVPPPEMAVIIAKDLRNATARPVTATPERGQIHAA